MENMFSFKYIVVKSIQLTKIINVHSEDFFKIHLAFLPIIKKEFKF